jgi:hypothetical protein
MLGYVKEELTSDLHSTMTRCFHQVPRYLYTYISLGFFTECGPAQIPLTGFLYP